MNKYLKYALIIAVGPIIGVYIATAFFFPMGITWVGDTTYPLELARENFHSLGPSIYLSIVIFGLPMHYLLRKYKKEGFWIYFSVGAIIGCIATPIFCFGTELFRKPLPFFESLSWVLTFRLFLPMFSTLIAFQAIWVFIVSLPRKKRL
jgi:hypothetical protein